MSERALVISETPVGPIVAVADGNRLTGLYPGEPPQRVYQLPMADPAEEPFASVLDQLGSYFAGQRTEFDLTLDPPGTAFQREVWEALLDIPFGETESYGELAERIGRPAAARAVGGACARSPIGIVVPCHRLVGANGMPNGAASSVSRKTYLLDLERRVRKW